MAKCDCEYGYLCDYICGYTPETMSECKQRSTFRLAFLAGEFSPGYVYTGFSQPEEPDGYDPCRMRGFWDGRY